ncbi:DUF4019 domain-containing protein [Burkholderia plantarii]|uniref:DUF4019 domain-containing protein n=1 Tax=Burkholderia plantarii TaxID=41899 RepID=A0A0B6RZ17_BURPL|nr:DUF4019 domain-containing protein [Burkholderia plantarii]AJK48648.1 hypothetical protein BGL_2c05640 [Burkholderia plantarii]ALK32882.1 hypothetical protein bpln_2g06200 [Burkholderia plantarii]WLE61950.1 DUF4019 domain-containing protein [Burkholderia plantarii]GLZ20299.1 hypothetical protein Bpla01_38280 [Burkholderia plantarii]
MKSTLTRYAAACVAAGAASLAQAQTPAPAAPAAPTLSLAPVNSGTSADELLRDADYALQLLDAGRYQDLWNDAAPFVKQRYDPKRFADDTRMSREAVGAIKSRGWAAVTRIIYSGAKDVPDGLYANVDYATTQTSGKVVYEKVSFRLESDGRWHLTGYVPRVAQGTIPGN